MENFVLSDYLVILRRWLKAFALTFAAIFVIAAFVATGWSRYRSTATIQIEQPQVRSDVTSRPGEEHDQVRQQASRQISSIMEKVTSTASLIEVVNKFNLYAAARANQPIAAVAERMRKQIKIDLIETSGGSRATQGDAIAFNLSFSYGEPLVTQQVADELASRFLDQDLRDRRMRAQETANFLAAQIEILETALSEQEKKIAEFQKSHGISRPETLAFNQQAAANLTVNVQGIDAQLTSIEGSLGSLRGQLAGVDPYSRVVADGQLMTSPTIQLKTLQSKYAALTAQYGPDHPDVVRTRQQIDALEPQAGAGRGSQIKAQIADVRANLAAARKTYGAEHPDVQALEAKLTALEQQAGRRSANATGIVGDADNPAYLQMVMQIRAAEEQRKALTDQRGKLLSMQEEYQKAIIANPEAQRELAELSRDYENAQMRYRELKAKKLAADMELKMQEERKGERLTLLNPPELPTSTTPSRKLLLLAGLFMAGGCGLAMVIFLQIVSGCVVGARQVEAIVGVAPLVCIPHISTREERQKSWQGRARAVALYGLARLRAALVKEGV